MQLTLSPRQDLSRPEAVLSVAGDVLTCDGVAYDLSAVPEGGEAIPEGDHPFEGSITRTGGQIVAKVVWHYTQGAADQPTDPAHWVVTVTDGPVPSPIVEAAQ